MGKSKAKKPTLEQKKHISAAGLESRDWLVLSDTAAQLIVVSRASGASRTVKKPLSGSKA